jgi:hypothetical protein
VTASLGVISRVVLVALRYPGAIAELTLNAKSWSEIGKAKVAPQLSRV